MKKEPIMMPGVKPLIYHHKKYGDRLTAHYFDFGPEFLAYTVFFKEGKHFNTTPMQARRHSKRFLKKHGFVLVKND